MVDPQLVNFIKNTLKEGISLSTIRPQLKEKGWPDKEIDDAVQSAISQETPTPKTKPSTPKAYCWNCGTENDATAKACKNCGTNLSETPKKVEGREITKISELSFQKKKNTDYEFFTSVKGSALPVDTFLEKLRERLSEQKVSSSQAKIKTGEMDTHVAGATFDGGFGNRRYGGATASSNIYANTWNPFDISYLSETHPFLGKFKGRIKLNEQAKYNKKAHDTDYEFKDYAFSGTIGFEPSVLLMFLTLVLGIVLSFIIGTGFWIGLAITIAFLSIFTVISMSSGTKELTMGIPQTKIKTAVVNLEKYLQEYSESIFNR